MQNSLVIGQQPRRDPQASSRNQLPTSEPSSKSQPPLTNAASSLSPMASRHSSQSSPKQSLQISECASLPVAVIIHALEARRHVLVEVCEAVVAGCPFEAASGPASVQWRDQ